MLRTYVDLQAVKHLEFTRNCYQNQDDTVDSHYLEPLPFLLVFPLDPRPSRRTQGPSPRYRDNSLERKELDEQSGYISNNVI